MATQNAIRDENHVASLLVESSTNSGITVRVKGNESTGRLLVSGLTVAEGYQTATGTVNGVNAIFVFTAAPNVVSIDQVPKQRVSSDGTVNWTGTTTITLAVAPNFDIYGIA